MLVRFSPAAQSDIQNIFDYIAFEDEYAARKVVAAIQSATRRLADFPLCGRTGAVTGTRELVVPRLPYIVVYVVSEHVDIIAEFNAAQNKPRGYQVDE